MLASRLVALLGAASVASGYQNGYTTCLDVPTSPHTSSFQTGTNPYSLSLKDSTGAVATSYTGGATYTVTLSGGTTKFKGFIMAGFQATTAALGTAYTATAKAGVMAPVRARARSRCPAGNALLVIRSLE